VGLITREIIEIISVTIDLLILICFCEEMSDSHPRLPSHPPNVPSNTNDDFDAAQEADEWKSIEIEEKPKSWKDSIFLPLGLFGGAIIFGGILVARGRNDGTNRGLSQRIMEARVAAQATLLAGIIGLGLFLQQQASNKTNTTQSVNQRHFISNTEQHQQHQQHQQNHQNHNNNNDNGHMSSSALSHSNQSK